MKKDIKVTCVCPYRIETGMFKGLKINKVGEFLIRPLQEEYAALRTVYAIL